MNKEIRNKIDDEDKLQIDILDYLGKHESGIIVMLSIGYREIYYDATFFYTEQMIALTPNDEFEKVIGCQIEDWDRYIELVKMIIKKIIPYKEMINRIDEFNPAEYGLTQSKI